MGEDTFQYNDRAIYYNTKEMDKEVEKGASGVARSATFAVLIILIVFFPILTLNGIEGKYFTPMAKSPSSKVGMNSAPRRVKRKSEPISAEKATMTVRHL